MSRRGPLELVHCDSRRRVSCADEVRRLARTHRTTCPPGPWSVARVDLDAQEQRVDVFAERNRAKHDPDETGRGGTSIGANSSVPKRAHPARAALRRPRREVGSRSVRRAEVAVHAALRASRDRRAPAHRRYPSDAASPRAAACVFRPDCESIARSGQTRSPIPEHPSGDPG